MIAMRCCRGMLVAATLPWLGAFAAEPYPGTVREWLVSGPWPSYHGDAKDSGLETDFLDLEADAVPVPGAKATATFVAAKGGTLEIVPSRIFRRACCTPSPETSRVMETF